MYRQTINHIKVAIIPIDGVIFDLNRYRYNYYHHLCNSKKIDISKEEFYNHLSNMYDMYNDLPLNLKEDVGPLNARIERELLQYLEYKGIKPREGFVELLEYLHQKDIKIAIMSTHRTKDAVNYLQQAKLYDKVHFIIGSDTPSLPLPSTQILETITEFFNVSNEETLVLSSFMALNTAAYQLHMNIIYFEDLIPARESEKQTSYKVVHSFFEVLNTLLFDRFEEAELYSPILGMNADMNESELNTVYEELCRKYKDDQQIIDLVDQTYEYHLSQLNQQNIKDGSLVIKDSHSKTHHRFSFQDEEEEEDDTITLEKPIFNNEDVIEKSEPVKEESLHHITPLNSQEEDELTTILQLINKKTPEDSIDSSDEIEDNVEEDIASDTFEYDKEKLNPVISFIMNSIYVCVISFLILFLGIIISVVFIYQIEAKSGFFGIIVYVFNGYYHIVETVFELIFNGLHAVLSFIPNYTQYSSSNSLFSFSGVQFLNIFIFNAMIIAIIRVIYNVIKERISYANDNQNSEF